MPADNLNSKTLFAIVSFVFIDKHTYEWGYIGPYTNGLMNSGKFQCRRAVWIITETLCTLMSFNLMNMTTYQTLSI